ncbi:hypothetical protein C7H19_00915 [Aphanothece hegewaldii CCALA 016]|uniref:VWA domain-containing protein n=1 Tax=Aphanothece hegewaldii CCALA 016 TaxID=2107694 RepID=A0A2T1M3G3_9CHRO|nr:vWA domain-containing protein [Aphanothece hegewaldii]PSF39379.1 hypothetical protein C7H19_00915 [Aphanothece hegewaldii CCALA 016]
MAKDCQTVIPGTFPTGWQKTGLEWVARLNGGRDVVLALDLTESVGLNDEGRTRLRQIVEKSLQPGDSVYIVPFASSINPLNTQENPLSNEKSIVYKNKKEDTERILQIIPFQSDERLQNTDIQQAELFIYQELAKLNQNRLKNNQPIQEQSIIWLTDAPLFTQAGIPSNVWIETPADSPFRDTNTPESQERQCWIDWVKKLPGKERSQPIPTQNNQTYNLTVVDLPPSIQEFCTPTPGGKQTCLVPSYLFNQLWLPVLGLILFTGASLFGLNYFRLLQKKWTIKVKSPKDDELKTLYLKNNQKITIGELEGLNTIYSPGDEIRGYIKRKGNSLYLEPAKNAEPIFYKGRELQKTEKIITNRIRLNCPDNRARDFETEINIIK